MKNFEVWATLILSIIGITGGSIAYSFTTFETKEHTQQAKEEILRKLERMEDKLDRLVEQKKDQ